MKRIIFTLFAALVLTFGMMDLGWAQGRPGHAGGGGGGGQAAPRSGGGGGQAAAPRGGGHATAPAPAPQGSARSRGDSAGAPSSGQASARPRGTGGPVYAQAAPRGSVPGSRIIVPYRYYGVSPWYYYSPYAYGAFGLGFWGYDPYWWGGYPYGYGWGYPYYGYGWGGYGYNYGYGGGYYDRGERDYGSLKLKVKPKEAEVYVDGYYMGQVDDFDGVFKHLDLENGTHRIEIRANGYEPLVFEMRIEPGKTVTYENRLRPAQGPR